MLQVKWLVAFLLVLCGMSLAAAQNSSSNRQSALAGAKKAAANITSRQPIVPRIRSSKQVPRPVAANRHGLMAARHPGLSYPLDQANLPPSGKVHSFPELSRARFLAPANIHPEGFPEFRAPQINKRKLLTAKPPALPEVTYIY